MHDDGDSPPGENDAEITLVAMIALLPRYPDFSAVIVGAITPDQTTFR